MVREDKFFSLLKGLGYERTRITGSHHRFQRGDHSFPIAVHNHEVRDDVVQRVLKMLSTDVAELRERSAVRPSSISSTSSARSGLSNSVGSHDADAPTRKADVHINHKPSSPVTPAGDAQLVLRERMVFEEKRVASEERRRGEIEAAEADAFEVSLEVGLALIIDDPDGAAALISDFRSKYDKRILDSVSEQVLFGLDLMDLTVSLRVWERAGASLVAVATNEIEKTLFGRILYVDNDDEKDDEEWDAVEEKLKENAHFRDQAFAGINRSLQKFSKLNLAADTRLRAAISAVAKLRKTFWRRTEEVDSFEKWLLAYLTKCHEDNIKNLSIASIRLRDTFGFLADFERLYMGDLLGSSARATLMNFPVLERPLVEFCLSVGHTAEMRRDYVRALIDCEVRPENLPSGFLHEFGEALLVAIFWGMDFGGQGLTFEEPAPREEIANRARRALDCYAAFVIRQEKSGQKLFRFRGDARAIVQTLHRHIDRMNDLQEQAHRFWNSGEEGGDRITIMDSVLRFLQSFADVVDVLAEKGWMWWVTYQLSVSDDRSSVLDQDDNRDKNAMVPKPPFEKVIEISFNHFVQKGLRSVLLVLPPLVENRRSLEDHRSCLLLIVRVMQAVCRFIVTLRHRHPWSPAISEVQDIISGNFSGDASRRVLEERHAEIFIPMPQLLNVFFRISFFTIRTHNAGALFRPVYSNRKFLRCLVAGFYKVLPQDPPAGLPENGPTVSYTKLLAHFPAVPPGIIYDGNYIFNDYLHASLYVLWGAWVGYLPTASDVEWQKLSVAKAINKNNSGARRELNEFLESTMLCWLFDELRVSSAADAGGAGGGATGKKDKKGKKNQKIDLLRFGRKQKRHLTEELKPVLRELLAEGEKIVRQLYRMWDEAGGAAGAELSDAKIVEVLQMFLRLIDAEEKVYARLGADARTKMGLGNGRGLRNTQ